MHIPKYRHFAARDKGFVEHAGKRTYFPGKFNSPESVASYAKFLESISESDTKGAKSDTPDLRATRADDVWIYTPFEHKTEHKKKARRIAIPQAAQEILKQYHHRPEEEFIFSPRETVRLISERKRAARKTKVQPSQIKRAERALKKALQNPPKHNPKYRTRAYERAIDRAASRAGVPAWSPNQLRHLFATETESRLDKESARLLLGHSHASTTEIYLDENTEKIKSAARRLESQ